jgi:GrpB-like predicted nucleotidyltransferase (UPF0157 family)
LPAVSSPDPTDVAPYDERLARATLGEPQQLRGRIEIREYDPAWPGLFDREAKRLRQVLGARAVLLEHVGSTSVPGLPAKPIVDLLLEVHDSADEAVYVPDLGAAGYVLRIREPEWFEHRLFKGPDTDVNVHVFSAGCEESGRMLRFRDWLRGNAADRALYALTKRRLAARDWKYVQQYADAKKAVVRQILARAEAAASRRG